MLHRELVAGEQALEADEVITPHAVSRPQAMARVHGGAKALTALAWSCSRRGD